MIQVARLFQFAGLTATAGLLLAGAAAADSITAVANGGALYLSQSFASTATGQTVATVTGTGANDGLAAAGNPLVLGSDLTGNGPLTSTYTLNQTFTNSSGSFSLGTLPTGDA